LTVLRCFSDLPKKAVNSRSALTLLALLGLKPDSAWAEAEQPQMGVTPIMDFIAVHYGKRYAPNSRETFRKDTLHQFLHETLVVLNPDDPARAINSPGNVYQVNPELCDAVKSFGQSDWSEQIAAFLEAISLRREQSDLERQMQRIPVVFGGTELALSPGGQNPLIKCIIEEFCERFAAGAQAVYIGDTDSKTQVFYNRELLESLGVTLDDHGKIPDVIVYQPEKNWLYLIEAVTSHGPMSETRKRQLEVLFKDCAAGLVFVTAFETRADMRRFLADLAWETEVWIANAPEHLIHFNGDRFLGPHE
jgi:BsuBI/PstI restriction endonuclease domain/BsuBI/PstI restriction endonuclease HTH domain